MDSRVFVFSSFNECPDFYFSGYCFVSSDYIYGLNGAIQYEKETGHKLSFDEDGCYALMRRVGDSYLFGSDYSGYNSVFYYHNPYKKIWIVSNSINLIVELLKVKGLEFTANYSQLNAMVLNKNFNYQLNSFNTSVNEIKVLPAHTYLTINGNCFSITRCKYNIEEISKLSYQLIVKEFLEMWISRYLTLVSNQDITILQDLTGGVDSRAMFAINHLANTEVLDRKPSNQKIISRFSRGDASDYQIAKEITDKYDYSLQTSFQDPFKSDCSLENYKAWKNLSLGSYHPIYFPSGKINPFHIRFNGVAGETYSPFYSSNSKNYHVNKYKDYVSQFNDSFVYDFLYYEYYDNIAESLSFISKRNPNLNKLILHYNNFRSRFHGGIFPRYTVCLTPLSSKFLSRALEVCGKERIMNRQIVYDLINSVEGLLSLPFDKPSKAPTLFNMENILKLQLEFESKVGKCFIGSSSLLIPEKKSNSSDSEIDFLLRDFDSAISKGFVQKFWGNDLISNAASIFDHSIHNSQFKHGRDGILISAILVSGWF